MSENTPQCPKCQSAYSYPDRDLWVCPECFHEWTITLQSSTSGGDDLKASSYFDSHGVQLNDGDAVTVVKDLKLGKEVLKSGTKVKNIRLLDDPVNGHDISCKIPGHGPVYLKCSVVKKA